MMNKLLLTVAVAGMIALAPTPQASAHVVYQDLMSDPSVTITNGADSTTYSAPFLFFVQTNYGWANAASPSWGDSHQGAWTEFAITGSAAYVDVSVFRADPTAIPSIYSGVDAGTLTPAFTLYSGVVPDESHDDATAGLPAQLGKNGAWNALGDTTMGNEAGDIGTISYIAHAGQGNTTASASLYHILLQPGVYTVALGGACNTCPQGGLNLVEEAYGTSLTVTPVPAPAAIYLFGSGVIGLVGLARRKMSGMPA
jgi:hypothetical protein